MTDNKKFIVEHFDEMKIGLDETFRFHCTACGKCCIHREDIILSPKDVYRAAKKLRFTPEQFIRQHGETYIGPDSRLPLVRLHPLGPDKRCPLLKGKLCSIHDSKPSVCAMFPLGRTMVDEALLHGEAEMGALNEKKLVYLLTDPQCGDQSEIHTVREWLGSFHIPEEDVYFLKWTDFFTECSVFLRREEKGCSEKIMNQLWSIYFQAIFLNYDMDEAFEPQFDRNTGDYLELIRSLEKLLPKEDEVHG